MTFIYSKQITSLFRYASNLLFIANEPAKRRGEAGEAAKNCAARGNEYAEKFSFELQKV